jgi:GNAT superfamily N-acetyltransferase
MNTLCLRREELVGATELADQELLKRLFPDVVDDYYGADAPERIVLLLHANQLIGHIAAYIRPVLLGGEAMTIGLIGGVAIDPNFRSQGHAKHLVGKAHEVFAEASLPFSVLFAYEPRTYRSSGYRPMTNETRFLEDGQWKQFVYRGGMVAELGKRRWPDGLLNLQGPAV